MLPASQPLCYPLLLLFPPPAAVDGPFPLFPPVFSAPTLPCDPTPPAPPLSVPFIPGSLTWCMLGCLLTHGSSRISQEGGADRVFLSLPGLSHRLPVPVCAAALLCHVLWPPQRQRETSAAGHWDIDPLQRPHLPDLNNRLFFANSTFYDWT